MVSLAFADGEYLENQIVCRAKSGEKIRGTRTFAIDNAKAEQVTSKIRVFTLNGGVSRGKKRVDFTILKKAKDYERKNLRLGKLISCAPNAVFELVRTTNDAMFGNLWGMAKINAPQAWDITTGSNQVKVAVLDTGILSTHVDIPSSTTGYNFYGNNSNFTDDNGHGTHVAGIIGGVGNNGVGVVGVNWNVSLLAVKVLGANGSGSLASVAAGTDYARQQGAHVMNFSLGAQGADYTPLRDALQAASNAGIVLVFAAGNSATNNDSIPFYPANYQFSTSITVAATTSNDGLASFSNFGATTVHVGAPGVGILSTVHNGGYASYSGTSMAAPHVAGLAALVKSANNSLSGVDLRNCILNTGDSLESLSGKTTTGKRINAFSAVSQCTNGAPISPPDEDTPPDNGDSPDDELGEIYLDVFGARVFKNGKVRALFEGEVDPLDEGILQISCSLRVNKQTFLGSGTVNLDYGYFSGGVDLNSKELRRSVKSARNARLSCLFSIDGANPASEEIRLRLERLRAKALKNRSKQ
jgi:hypothetical protein